MVQYLLRAQGYDLAADGIFGPGTADAVSRFQAAKGFSVTGKVESALWEALIVPLRLGDQGDAVRAVQKHIDAVNPFGGTLVPDGVFTEGLQRLIQSVQAADTLPVDGVVSPDTWYELARVSERGPEAGFMPPRPAWIPRNVRFFTSAAQGCEATPQTTFAASQPIQAQLAMDEAPAGTRIEVLWKGGIHDYIHLDTQVTRAVRPACVDGFRLETTRYGIGPGTYQVILLINGVTYETLQVTAQGQ
jgi:peptidoglycan hydrolase-like protein with peptidoglycan-binding domain